MAKPKLNRTVLDFYTGEGGQFLIDIPRALSLYNLKSFRSGYIYSVDYIEIISDAGKSFTLSTLPQSYVTLQAYKLGFELWKQQRADAIQESGVEPGKWSDFKPFFNQDHLDGVITEMVPRGMGGLGVLQPLDLTGSEWNRAEVQINDLGAATTSTVNIGMLGANDLLAPTPYGSLIEAYGNTRAAVLSPDPLIPDVADSSWILRTGQQSGEMISDVVDYIEVENDQPPYANQADTALPMTYLGNSQSATHGLLLDKSVTGTTGRAIQMNGGLIPLGMIHVNSDATAFTVRVHCTPGMYKGAVAALPMGEFS